MLRNIFGNKNEFDFKIGDVVKFKNGIRHHFLKTLDISDWHGRIIEVDKNSVGLELDSLSLREVTDELIDIYDERGEYPYLLTIPVEDIEPSEARDTDEETEKMQDEVMEKIHQKEGIEKHEIEYNKWKRHFQRSGKFMDMDKSMRDNSDFVMETFYNYMYNYEGKKPRNWNPVAVKEVMLNWVPNKISAEADLFKTYGDIVLCFMEFLDERQYLKTGKLQKIVAKFKEETYTRSQDSSSWGFAKSFMMGAMDAGVDMSDKGAMDKYLKQQQLNALGQLGGSERKKLEENLNLKPVDKRQFRGIWQNQKVTVKYDDGNVLENVKFKEVKEDLYAGLCQLVKK